MKVLLCRAPRLGSWLIRTLSWSDWSHSAILLDDQTVIEAAWPTVRISALADVLKTHQAYIIVNLPCPFEGKALGMALQQIGKPYDWRALFGFLFHRDWTEPDSWFCSELVTWCAMQGGARWFRPESLNRITPQNLWMVPPEERGAAYERQRHPCGHAAHGYRG